jgi:hypothetical protein
MTRHRAMWRPLRALWHTLQTRAAACAILCVAGAVFASAAGRAADSAVKQPSPSDVAPAPSAKQASPEPPKCCKEFRVRAQDQVWVVSTRCLGCPSGAKTEPAWQLWRYEKAMWQPATATEFYASDSKDLVTPFYIHGNRIDHPQACSDGLSVYFQLVGKLDDEPPARFVIWSWPSSQIKGPLNDVRTKAARSDVDAYYLARFMAGMKPEVRVGLVGYSFGARIASGALHLIGGGSLLGQTIETTPRPQIRVALWAAAEHNYWYLPGNYHDRAIATGDAWFITINCCDPVLSRYRFLDPCGDPVAVGYAGIYGRNLLPADVNERIEEVNVSNIVGGTHDKDAYLYSLYIQNRTRDYVLWHELAEKQAADTPALAAAD